MEKNLSCVDIREQSPISLAFVGDGCLELMVRARLVQTTRLLPNQLHAHAVRLVSAKGQAQAVTVIEPLLSAEETAILHRGKNASKATVAKHATPAQYRASTGLEALFGWLYLTGAQTRLEELFETIWNGVYLAPQQDAEKPCTAQE